METVDISTIGLISGFSLLLIPIVISLYLKLGMISNTLWSVGRMSVQLFLVGFFLEFIFEKNNTFLNLAWITLMIFTAIFSAISSSKLKIKPILPSITISFGVPTLLILLYFNAFIIRLDYLFEARYLIAIGGMLLGNVLSVNIVGINSFYEEIKTQNKYFLYRLGMGATRQETLFPFFKKSFQLSLKPALAKTATIGLVSLPGMMSGQILGGSSPTTAIKYQIVIMIAIYVVGTISVTMSLILSTFRCFNQYGVLREDIFKKD